jgi:hypothetical protein
LAITPVEIHEKYRSCARPKSKRFFKKKNGSKDKNFNNFIDQLQTTTGIKKQFKEDAKFSTD